VQPINKTVPGRLPAGGHKLQQESRPQGYVRK
jgi:hypothetical protein